MKTHFLKMKAGICVLFFGLASVGCVTTVPYDYTNYRASFPRSILVLPPLNETTDIRGTYSYLSTVTYPVAEMGYYVYPVVLADQLLKENGLPTPGEMHQAPLSKLRKVFGADAVLYVTLREYGTKYQVLSSVTRVTAQVRLVDTVAGTVLWEGVLSAQDDGGGNNSGGGIVGALINAAVKQAINSSTDHGRHVSRSANRQLTSENRGLLYGPYHPKYGSQ
jgi:hypothetical protein